MHLTILPHFLDVSAMLSLEVLGLELIHLDLLGDYEVGFDITFNFPVAIFCFLFAQSIDDHSWCGFTAVGNPCFELGF